jgi:hypothetical protein
MFRFKSGRHAAKLRQPSQTCGPVTFGTQSCGRSLSRIGAGLTHLTAFHCADAQGRAFPLIAANSGNLDEAGLGTRCNAGENS